MDFIGILIFFVVAIASLAQKAQEGRKAKEAKGQLAQRRDQRQAVAKRGESTVRQAKPKGASSQRPAGLSPETTGGELIKALFGEAAVDSNEGWTAVEPEPRRELPKHTQQSVPQQDDGGNVRDAVIQQREEMERSRADHPAKAHDQKKHRAPQQQPPREQVMAERQRRKEQARQHREKATTRQKQQTQQQRRAPRPVAPVARQTFVPRTLNDVRRAIVMAEILGSPKAYEDR